MTRRRRALKVSSALAAGMAAAFIAVFAVQMVSADDSPVWNPDRPLGYGWTEAIVSQPPPMAEITLGGGGATVKWSPPLDQGSHLVTHYAVESDPESSGCLVDGVTECFISSLNVGTTYRFRAKALNAAGWSAWSEWSLPVTVMPQPNPTVTVTGRWVRRAFEVRVVGTDLPAGAPVEIYVRRTGQVSARPLAGVYVLDSQGAATVRITQRVRSPLYVYASVEGVQSRGVWLR